MRKRKQYIERIEGVGVEKRDNGRRIRKKNK